MWAAPWIDISFGMVITGPLIRSAAVRASSGLVTVRIVGLLKGRGAQAYRSFSKTCASEPQAGLTMHRLNSEVDGPRATPMNWRVWKHRVADNDSGIGERFFCS